MTGLKLITFDLDNTLWPVDEVIRQAEKTCSDWIAEHHPSAAAALTAERVRTVRDELVRAHPDYLNNLTRLRRDAMARAPVRTKSEPNRSLSLAFPTNTYINICTGACEKDLS